MDLPGQLHVYMLLFKKDSSPKNENSVIICGTIKIYFENFSVQTMEVNDDQNGLVATFF